MRLIQYFELGTFILTLIPGLIGLTSALQKLDSRNPKHDKFLKSHFHPLHSILNKQLFETASYSSREIGKSLFTSTKKFTGSFHVHGSKGSPSFTHTEPQDPNTLLKEKLIFTPVPNCNDFEMFDSPCLTSSLEPASIATTNFHINGEVKKKNKLRSIKETRYVASPIVSKLSRKKTLLYQMPYWAKVDKLIHKTKVVQRSSSSIPQSAKPSSFLNKQSNSIGQDKDTNANPEKVIDSFSKTKFTFPSNIIPPLDSLSNASIITAIQGRLAKVKCTGGEANEEEIVWIFYSKFESSVLSVGRNVLTANKRIKIVVEQDIWTLQIHDTIEDDEGVYMCQLNTVPIKKTYSVLEVLVPPEITIPPKDVTVIEGGNVTLQCQGSGDPAPNITWREETLGRPSSRVDKLREWKSNSLTILNVTRNDALAYLCVATNGVPPAVSARVQIYVEYPPEILNSGNETSFFRRGTNYSLICSFEAYPNPEVQWVKKTHGIEENLTFLSVTKISLSKRGLSELRLRNLTKWDFGHYYCKIENKLGIAIKHFLLKESKLPNISTRPTSNLDQVVTTGSPQELPETNLAKSEDEYLSFSNIKTIDNIITRYLKKVAPQYIVTRNRNFKAKTPFFITSILPPSDIPTMENDYRKMSTTETVYVNLLTSVQTSLNPRVTEFPYDGTNRHVYVPGGGKPNYKRNGNEMKEEFPIFPFDPFKNSSSGLPDICHFQFWILVLSSFLNHFLK